MNEKRLMRRLDDRMLFGVCSGLAGYLEVDPVLVRIFFVLFALYNGLGLVLYLVLALLMPADKPAPKVNHFDADEEIIVKDAG